MAEKELKPWADRYVDLTNRQLHRLLSDVEMGVYPEYSALERAIHLKLVSINDKEEMSLTKDGKSLLDKLRPPFLKRHGYVYKRAQLSDTALLEKLYEDEYYAYELGLSDKVSPAKIERAKKNVEKLRQQASERGLHFIVTDTISETGGKDFWEEYNPKASSRSADWLEEQEDLLDDLYDLELSKARRGSSKSFPDQLFEDMFDKVLMYAHEGRAEVGGDAKKGADYGIKEYIRWENRRMQIDAPIVRKHVVKELEREWATPSVSRTAADLHSIGQSIATYSEFVSHYWDAFLSSLPEEPTGKAKKAAAKLDDTIGKLLHLTKDLV